MLVVREAQLDSLEREGWRRFTDKLRRHVLRVFPEKAAELTEAELKRVLEHTRKLAARCEMSSELELTLLFDLRLGLGNNYEEQPECAWIGETLERVDLDGFEKLALIYDQLPRAARGKAT